MFGNISDISKTQELIADYFGTELRSWIDHTIGGENNYFDTANIAKGNDATTDSTNFWMTQFLQPSCVLNRDSPLDVRASWLCELPAYTRSSF